MEKRYKTPKECLGKLMPVRDTLDIFQGKWKIQIISVLMYYDECSFKLLKESVKGITSKMLSKELKELELNQLVEREVIDTRPVTIRYRITPYGESSRDIIIALYNWGVEHRKKIIGKE
ncbi:helix-turn-helix domain-containing protein [Flammeovirga sp. OC4]|uniref:winged helix-turn-helix transcriptional regulator n=1 Tax=Flammeovirga sp. OC4 TaxID=1382345 RepID=UPI0005C46C34|nr:helix-turn-helix domain-containing protein [Flammeovirga sp. OC4]